MATLAIRLITTPANSVPSELAFLVQNIIHNKLRNLIRLIKAAKPWLIYINSWVVKYDWSFKEKNRQEPTRIILSEDEEIEIEDANIKSFYFDN